MLTTNTAPQNRYATALVSIFCFALLILPFSPLTSSLIAVLSLLALFNPGFITYCKSIYKNPLVITIVLFLLLILLRTTLGDSIIPHKYTIKAIVRWLLFISMLILGVFFQNENIRNKLITYFVIGYLISGCLRLTAHFSEMLQKHGYSFLFNLIHTTKFSDKLFNYYTTRNVQDIATIYAIVAAICLLRAISKLRINYKTTIIYLIAAFILCLNIFAQQERIGYLTMIILIPYVAYCTAGIRKGIYTLIVLLFACILAYKTIPHFHERVSMMFSNLHPTQYNPETNTGIRIIGIKTALVNFKERPIIGYGIGSFNDGNNFINLKKIHVIAMPFSVENSFLTVLLNLGIIGLAIFLVMLASVWLYSRRNCSDLQSKEIHCILLGLCIGSMTFRLFYNNSGIVLLSTIVSLTLGATAAKNQSKLPEKIQN